MQQMFQAAVLAAAHHCRLKMSPLSPCHTDNVIILYNRPLKGQIKLYVKSAMWLDVFDVSLRFTVGGTKGTGIVEWGDFATLPHCSFALSYAPHVLL